MKPNCQTTIQQISDHLDSDTQRSPETNIHLQTCPTCTRFLNSWKTGGNLHTIATTPTPTTTSIADKIYAQLPTTTPKSKTIPFFPILAAAAAIALGIFIHQTTKKPAPHEQIITQTLPPKPSPQVTEFINKFDEENLSSQLVSLGQSSSQLINNSSKSIHLLTSKIEYVSSNISKFIPIPTPQNNPDTSILIPGNNA